LRRAWQGAGGTLEPEGTAVAGRRGDVERFARHGDERFVERRVAGGGERPEGGAVIRRETADDAVPYRLAVGEVVLPRELDGGLDRFRPARDVEHAFESLTEPAHQGMRQVDGRLALE